MSYLLVSLASCRREKYLSQEELAEKADISRVTVAKLERLRRRARGNTVRKLAQALGVKEDSLLRDSAES